MREHWRGDDLEAETRASIASDTLEFLVIEDPQCRILGAIQWAEEEEADYRHASIDLFLDPAVHRRGFGSDALRSLVRYLFEEKDFHRVAIDPAAHNAAAIAAYAKVGFRPVGVMRQYERGADGTWHDGLLMDLLRSEFDG